MKTVRVQGVQMPISKKLDENLQRILSHLKPTDADFVLFPEMSLTGNLGDFSQKAVDRAWNQIAEACRHAYTTALIGTGCQTEDGTYIQTRIFGAQGQLMGTYEKIMATTKDREFCRPGGELRVFRHADVNFGCLIGNDLWVTPGFGPYPDPRLTFQLHKKGAQVIFHSVNSGASAIHGPYYESNLVLRAIESSIYICTANAATNEGPVNCPSGVMSPEGKWLVQCARDGEHTYTCDIEGVAEE
jgi:predicted amidohydrolase